MELALLHDLLDTELVGTAEATPKSKRRARLSLDEQILDAAERHQAFRAEDFARNAAVAKALMPWRNIPLQPEVGCFDVFCLEKDPQYLELVARSEEEETESDNAKHAKWRNDCRQKIRTLLMDLQMTEDVRRSETRLRGVYEWYDQQKPAFGERPSSLEHAILGAGTPKADNTLIHPHIHPLIAAPGSMPPAPLTSWSPVIGQDLSEAAPQQQPQQQQHTPHLHRLLPARERLKQFKTHQIVKPFAARKLHAERLEEHPGSAYNCSYERSRSVTPSTSAGGSTTRSFASTIASARSSPTPLEMTLASRPSSASGWSIRSARHAAASRPRSALAAFSHRARPPVTEERLVELSAFGMHTGPLSPLSKIALQSEVTIQAEANLVHEAATEDAEHAAEKRMEERWHAHRNRDVAQQLLQEERKMAISEWSEKRARVEEEISRNAEVVRFQSELVRRDWVPPPGAQEHIAPSISVHPCADEMQRMPSQGTSGAAVENGPPPEEFEDFAAPEESAQRASEYSASRLGTHETTGSTPQSPGSRSPRVTFPPEATESSQKPALNAKVAHLRRLHARLLQAPQDSPDNKRKQTDSISEGCVSSHSSNGIKSVEKEEKESHAPLSTHRCGRMPDETDVLAALCPSWQGGLQDEGIVTHDQIREHQMREAEEVRRVFWNRRYFIDPSILESALVSPARHLPGDAQPLNVKRIMQRSPFDRVLQDGHPQTKPTKPQRRGNGRRVPTARSQSARSPTGRSSNTGSPTVRTQTASSSTRKRGILTGRRRAASARR